MYDARLKAVHIKIVLHVQELCWDDDEGQAYTNHPR